MDMRCNVFMVRVAVIASTTIHYHGTMQERNAKKLDQMN